MRRYCFLISMLILTGYFLSIVLTLLILTQVVYAGHPGYFISMKRRPDNYTVPEMQVMDPLLSSDKTVTVYLHAQFVTGPQNFELYSFIVECEGKDKNDLLYIKDGESLILIADDKKINLEGEGSRTENIFISDLSKEKNKREPRSNGAWSTYTHGQKGYSREKAWFDISKEQLQTIASAKKVEVIVYGKNDRSVQKEFDKIHFKNLKEFIDYCEKMKNRRR